MEFNSSLLVLRPKLYRFAKRLTSDNDKAHDLTQDTILKALTFRDKFTEFTNIQAWVFTIMKNTFINNYRRSIRENSFIEYTQNIYFFDKAIDNGILPAESGIAVEDIETSIDKLSNDLSIPFRMHVEGYKYKEIADKLGIKVGTVKSRIFLSRIRLMKGLRFHYT